MNECLFTPIYLWIEFGALSMEIQINHRPEMTYDGRLYDVK